jgi:hypothetical protein
VVEDKVFNHAEIERARLANIGQAQAQGFQTAAGLAAQQQGLQVKHN